MYSGLFFHGNDRSIQSLDDQDGLDLSLGDMEAEFVPNQYQHFGGNKIHSQ